MRERWVFFLILLLTLAMPFAVAQDDLGGEAPTTSPGGNPINPETGGVTIDQPLGAPPPRSYSGAFVQTPDGLKTDAPLGGSYEPPAEGPGPAGSDSYEPMTDQEWNDLVGEDIVEQIDAEAAAEDAAREAQEAADAQRRQDEEDYESEHPKPEPKEWETDRSESYRERMSDWYDARDKHVRDAERTRQRRASGEYPKPSYGGNLEDERGRVYVPDALGDPSDLDGYDQDVDDPEAQEEEEENEYEDN